MMEWQAPQKPAEVTDSRLITSILTGRFPIGTSLPAERELAGLLGVTRPTLREALQRLARDGWIEIHQGRSTRVRNYWHEGNLGVLGALAQFPEHAPDDFITNLLAIRLVLAPAYTRQAFAKSRNEINLLLGRMVEIEDRPAAFANADWTLHHQLTILSGNPIYTLILNGFEELYLNMSLVYFALETSRSHSRRFYQALTEAAQVIDLDWVETLTRDTMAESLELWRSAKEQVRNNEERNALR